MELKEWTATCGKCNIKLKHSEFACNYCKIGKIFTREKEGDDHFPTLKHVCNKCNKEQFAIFCPKCKSVVS